MHRRLIGSVVGIALAIGLSAALLPVRDHLSVASAALVLVLPVVAGAIIGGFAAGTFSVLAGFVVYDFWFIPPYGHLSVASSQDWVVLAVYVAVMLAVARVVSNLESARAEALSADGRGQSSDRTV